MHISMIAAGDIKNAIGYNNRIVWHLPDDLRYFKRRTMGKVCLVGRNTYNSLPQSVKTSRRMCVISKSLHYDNSSVYGVESYPNPRAAIWQLRTEDIHECIVIGGGQLYQEMMEYADTLYYTHVLTQLRQADAWFPEISKHFWKETESLYHTRDSNHNHPFFIKVYQRIRPNKYI